MYAPQHHQRALIDVRTTPPDGDPPAAIAWVAGLLRRLIARGDFFPGQCLPEAALRERLEVSPGLLREAFCALAKEGLLKREPHGDVRIAIPSIESIIDIYRVRRLVECQAVASARSWHPARSDMRAAVEMGLHCRRNGDWVGVGAANLDFHESIVRLADSEKLNELFGDLLCELQLGFRLLGKPGFMHAPYLDRNMRILELFEARKLADCASTLDDYLNHSEQVVLAVYAQRWNQTVLDTPGQCFQETNPAVLPGFVSWPFE
ncbi:GntR family transcriptional regulator [Variovorax sp. 770b2]|uniref:GntR family transcriptional regulator n=1 Tax=Variovorax sp. 770b2 TaxID=1566271 RepID=UPI0008EF0EB0|nr:GntR family transcriptional regulator [Variovorax sp. 770b2]SFQ32717.1 DNA-binding transcriptional regulator, GntR family [Variovorax sp. 770b2]